MTTVCVWPTIWAARQTSDVAEHESEQQDEEQDELERPFLFSSLAPP